MFVINLPFKRDRLSKFLAKMPESIGPIEVWQAVHGDTVRPPAWWTAGNGAWGCYRSHMQILESCYNQGVGSYIVFEDDAVFRDGFDDLFSQFVDCLPQDWEMLYLGGQLLHELNHRPKRYNAHCYVPYNVNRTHAFAVHSRGYEKLYQHLSAVPFHEREHIDHHLGRIHESGQLKVFCPGKWLVGQDAGPSNISGNINDISFWMDPERLARTYHHSEEPISILLESPKVVADELRYLGWHSGYWRNDDGLDVAVCEAVLSGELRPGITRWHQVVCEEWLRDGHKGVCLFHPELTWQNVQDKAEVAFSRVVATSVENAQEQLQAIVGNSRLSAMARLPTHLCYKVISRRNSNSWQFELLQVLRRIDLFDGVRSIAVSEDEGPEVLEVVQVMCQQHRIENWIVLPAGQANDETSGLILLLNSVRLEAGITFCAFVSDDHFPEHTGYSEKLIEAALDYPELVTSVLADYPIAVISPPQGIIDTYPSDRSSFEPQVSGLMWFRNADLFGRDGWCATPLSGKVKNAWLVNNFSRDEIATFSGPPLGYNSRNAPATCAGETHLEYAGENTSRIP